MNQRIRILRLAPPPTPRARLSAKPGATFGSLSQPCDSHGGTAVAAWQTPSLGRTETRRQPWMDKLPLSPHDDAAGRLRRRARDVRLAPEA